MTYFLMFQLGFMVIGWLYSLWRILLALVVMLLYSVAALDRSLLHTAQASALMLRKPCAHLHAVCPPAEDHQSTYVHGKLRMQPTVSLHLKQPLLTGAATYSSGCGLQGPL